MTLTVQNPKEIKNGNGSTTVFSFTFVLNQSSDLVVTHTNAAGVETTVTAGTGTTNYSISLPTTPGNGSITYPATLGTELATGATLTLQRVVDLDQDTDLVNQGAWNPSQVEDALDYSRMIDLQQKDELDRSIKIPVSDATGTTVDLPTETLRANKAIVFDSDGDVGISVDNYVDQVATVATSATAAATSATAAATSATAAATSATASSTSATASSTSATASSTSATSSSTSATASAASATASEASAGALAWKYTFDNSTTMADPGTGDIRFNHATLASVTAIAIDATSADTGNPDVSDLIASIDDGTNSAHEGYIFVRKSGTPATFMAYNVTGAIVDNTGWLQIPVTHAGSGGSLSAADTLYISFARSGNVGPTGSTGSTGAQGASVGTALLWDTDTSDADSGNGKIFGNNATVASITQLYIDDLDSAGTNIEAWIQTMDDSTTTAARGTITIVKTTAQAQMAVFTVNSAVVDGTGYWKIPCAHVVSNVGSLADGNAVTVTFTRAGNIGATGSTGATGPQGDATLADVLALG